MVSIYEVTDSGPINTVKNKTASFGIAYFYGDDTVERILKRVDEALHQAKKRAQPG